MKAFAVHTIQRGKSAVPSVVKAGEIFDASDAELLHLTPVGAVRKPTTNELAIDRWKKAEDEDQGANDAAALVASVFGDTPTSAAEKPEAEPVDTGAEVDGDPAAKAGKAKPAAKSGKKPAAEDDLDV